jgi:transcriptional regulator with GAF, ATPase, and Fis domain
MENREAWLAEVFVELADTLTVEFDLIEFLSILCERCAELLDGPQVGVMLSDARGKLRHVASSTEDMRLVELLELQHDEGPCLDCFSTATAVLDEALERSRDRWPSFAPGALAAGFPMVSALPLRLRDDVIGAMNIFHVDAVSLDPVDVRLAQALADIATVGLLQQRAISSTTELATQLQTALSSRIMIEQAKGMVGAELGVSVDEAFGLLRSFARSHNLHLVDVAAAVLNRSRPAVELRRGATPRSRSQRSRPS